MPEHYDLYECPPTRSQRAKWVLEELGIAHNSHLVDLPGGGLPIARCIRSASCPR
ncbi:MAG: hypothetical protein O2910_04320 [Proteobacteria bacterium]|nr:hypothetical protein [Pseudomonadota bacterium]